jgi:hypothetical protein
LGLPLLLLILLLSHLLALVKRSPGCSISATTTVTIPPFSSNTRRPANIPLHTLSSSSRNYTRTETGGLLDDDEHGEKHSSTRSSLSADSSYSIWSGSDTGDLVDQLAETQDPLDRRLQESLDAELLPRGASSGKHKGRGHQQKRTRFHSDVDRHDEKEGTLVRRKEDIPIPNPKQRKIPLGERLLVRIMAPNDGPSRIHGLHGKKLL